MRTRLHSRLAKVERVLGQSPDKKLDEHMARVMALLSYTDQTLLPSERVAGATVSEQQRLAEQRYDAAMQSLMAELTDDELTVMIDRLSEQGFNEQVVDPKPV
jgi:hypothetical protein